MNLLGLWSVLADFKRDMESHLTKKLGKKFQYATIRTEKKCCLQNNLNWGYKVLDYGL